VRKKKIIYDWWAGSTSNELQYIIPSEFSAEFTDRIWRAEGETIYQTDFDWTIIPNAITGNTAYVDLSAGVNGSGTEGSPFNNIASAVAGSFNIFMVKGRGRNANSKFTGTKNIKILPWPGFDPPEFTTQTDTDLVWAQNGTEPTVYDATWPSASGFINNVLDRAVLDSDGSYTGYTSVGSLANVAAGTARFWYESAANTLHVRTADGRVPDADIVGLVTGGTILSVTGNVSSTKYIYAQGCKFFGANQTFQVTNAGSAYVQIGFEDCEFNHSTGTEASVYINGKARGYFKECNSFYNRDDGFDYNSTDSFFFEWYCKAGKNTWTGTAVNGSTAHSSSKVIRVGGDYQFSAGKPVQDIETSRSYNLGCISGNANAANPNNYGYATSSVAGTTIMYLIECQQTGPAGRGYINFSSQIINLYDGDIGNIAAASNSNSGTVNVLTEGDVFS
jgi:hypothetical protein